MSPQELEKKIAQLETQNDHLMTEISTLDHLMRSLGFSEGIATVRATAYEIIDSDMDI